MSAISDYLEGNLLDLVFNGVSYTAPTALTLALFKTNPTDAGSGTEVSTGTDDANYARQTIVFSAASEGAVSNSATVNFPAAAIGSNYTVSHFGIFDELGNLLWHGPLGSPSAPVTRAIADGEVLSFPVGAIVCTLD